MSEQEAGAEGWRVVERPNGTFEVQAWDHGHRWFRVATRSLADRLARLPSLEADCTTLQREVEELRRERDKTEIEQKDMTAEC